VSVPDSSRPWPALPTRGFVTGRAATQQDMADGDAVFVAEVGGQIVGEPLDITVPQYAIHIDHEAGVGKRVIVLQAERAGGIEMIGYVELETDAYGVGTAAEFEFLGTAPATDRA
jgi:hypothetical protein